MIPKTRSESPSGHSTETTASPGAAPEAPIPVSEAADDERPRSAGEPHTTPTVARRWRTILGVAGALVLVILGIRLFGGAPKAAQSPSLRPTPVRAAAVQIGDLAVESTYSGELVGEVADIAPKVSGLLQSVPLRIGDRVQRGQLIAEVDDLELRNQLQEAEGQLGVARANQRRAAAELESADADRRRADGLYAAELLSEQEYDGVRAKLATSRANLAASEAQTEQARARLALLQQQVDDTRVMAPFDGVVASRYLDRGALVQPGTPILRLVEAEPLLVQFKVPERDLGAIAPGVRFTVLTQATGATEYHGTVRRVSGEVNRSDRTALVEGELIEDEPLLRPGMYAEVRVRVRELREVPIVPGEAVLERLALDGTKTHGVFVVDGEHARWRPLEILGQARGLAAIAGEIVAGDLVLTLGHAELLDDAEIRVVQRQNVSGSGESAS